MALSQQSQNVRKIHQVYERYKEAERELEALKTYFREQAKGEDVTFSYRELDVVVTSKSRSGWDQDKLTLLLGDKADGYRKTSSYLEVSCRKSAKAAA